MVLGYFGKTPVEPDPEIVKLASEKLKLEPTTESPLDLADKDETKSIAYWKKKLEDENIETTEENIFIAAACQEKGIAFLKGESPLMVRKKGLMEEENKENSGGNMSKGVYTVVVNGEKFDVVVSEGSDSINVESIQKSESTNEAPAAAASTSSSGVEVRSPLAGNVWKIKKNVGDQVKKGDVVIILEAMKMEIDVEAPADGVVSEVLVKEGDSVEDNQLLMKL